MKRFSIAGFTLLFLVGCAQPRKESIEQQLIDRLALVAEYEYHAPNQNKSFYSYYIQPSVGRLDGDISSNVLTFYDAKFVMNLNVSSIINEKYYKEYTDFSSLNPATRVALVDGEFVNRQDGHYAYRIELHQMSDYYFLYFQSNIVNFYAFTDPLLSVDLAGIMLDIARNTSVHEQEVLSFYSNKETLNIVTKKMELFDSIAPETGRVEELFEDYRDETDQIEQETGEEIDNR